MKIKWRVRNMSQFRVGSFVIKPGLGICRIKAIRKQEVSGATLEFYVLTSGEVDIMVPFSVAHAGGLRLPLSEEDIEKIFKLLEEPAVYLEEDQIENIDLYSVDIDKGREEVKHRNIDEILHIVRYLFNRQKLLGQLPKEELDLFNDARKTLADEIAHVQRTTRQRIMTQVTRMLTEARKRRKEKFESPLAR